MKSNTKEEAFKNVESFKNAISTKEFEAVLKIVENQYERVSSFVQVRKETLERSKEKMREAKKNLYDINSKDFSDAIKESKAILFAADKEIYESMKVELDNINNITEFLNRFREPSRYLEKVNVSFINRLKTK